MTLLLISQVLLCAGLGIEILAETLLCEYERDCWQWMFGFHDADDADDKGGAYGNLHAPMA